ncbi:MAG: hypothetical protein Q7J60_24515 [Bradyrhizobium sp.]|nr:hypothetical protein [Bradyrhizobium sp.]
MDIGFNVPGKAAMSASKSPSIEAAIGSILADHFEQAENPHETIYRIWLLLNARALAGAMPASDPEGAGRDGRSRLPSAKYN